MSKILLLATSSGIAIAQRDNEDWVQIGRGLLEKNITSIALNPHMVYAGTTDGVFRYDQFMDSTDTMVSTQAWQPITQGLSIPHIRCLANFPDDSNTILAGTEPAGIFISNDRGEQWRACPEVVEFRQEYDWYLPYSPAAGCIRGFAGLGEKAYAAAEDGGVLVSEDRGETWRMAEGSRGVPDHTPPEGYIHSDVHSIQIHPSNPDLVFAPTGGGLYTSTDAGKTWRRLYTSYSRAIWVDPQDPKHLIFGPAGSVDQDGRIEESCDGGETWASASSGLETPWPRTMVEQFWQVGGDLLAMLSNGELFQAKLHDLQWKRILPDIKGIAAIATMEI